jgi:phosphoribosyl 1,2-cyclic phosphate phosphodiesterase
MPSRPLTSPPLTVTFLGSGTSTGVPMIGCDCPVCQSPNPRDKRMRPSILVTVPRGDTTVNLLVDTTPDMRTQMLRAGIGRIEAALITHPHADHILGMDDIRQFNFRHSMPMPIYGTPETLDHLRIVFSYCFRETQTGGGKPQLILTDVTPYEPFEVFGVTITPLIVMHGKLPVVAYKFGEKFAYVTDVSAIPEEARPHLRGLDTLILGTVRYEPHPTHFGLQQALDEIADLAPRQTYLTHLSHHFDHDVVNASLPANIRMGYDGLRFDIPAGGVSPT